MKIALVNTYANGGGAATAAHRLHEGLNKLGHNSTMYVEYGQGDGTALYHPARTVFAKVARKMRSLMIKHSSSVYRKTRPQGLEIFSDDRSPYGHNSTACIPECDVISFHWVAGFIDYTSIPKLRDIPMVWTLHDMNPFTGGCHYNNGCSNYLLNCGKCPQLGSKRSEDLSAKIWRRKEAAFSQLSSENFHVVTPSKWLAAEALHSKLLSRFQITVIPNGLDTDIFCPQSTNGLRRAFDIPIDAHIVLFLADSITNKRKGLQLLLDAIGDINTASQVILLTVGSSKITVPCPSIRHIKIGRIEDERILSMIYSLADVFVIPSLQDNLPNTVLESFACGTPVVGFNIGGIPDMVKDGETGFLAATNNIVAMKTAIETILTDTILRKSMSDNCRNIAVEKYDSNLQAKRYITMFESIIKTKLRNHPPTLQVAK